MKRFTMFVFALLFIGIGAGCSTTSLLPSAHEHTIGDVAWGSYADAEKFYNQVESGKSTLTDLAVLGFNVRTAKNLVVLDRSTFASRFVMNAPQNSEFIDPAVKECLLPTSHCVPHVLKKDISDEIGIGSVLSRLMNFKKESVVRGWNVEILILTKNDVVVYKQIMGTPNGTERWKAEHHPLGPLEGVNISDRIKR